MFPYDVLRPRKQLRKLIAVFSVLFVFFVFGAIMTEKDSLLQENEKYKENERDFYFGMKTKPYILGESPRTEEKGDIFYLDGEQNNVVADDQLQIVTSRPVKRLPKALIIGVKKSGTKTLQEFLRIHPDICTPANEVHYFTRNYHKGLEWYRRQMPVSVENQMTIERTRGYYVHGDVPQRIALQIPTVRLIVVVRNPVLRALLDYTSQCDRNKSDLSFMEAFFWNNITGFIDMSRDFIQTSMYVKFLENWFQYFRLDQFHFVNGDMLYRNPSHELNKLEGFLKIRNLISSDHFYYNTSRDSLCIKKHDCQGRPHCFSENKLKTYPPPFLLRRLREFFHPFNEKFYRQTKQRFYWNV